MSLAKPVTRERPKRNSAARFIVSLRSIFLGRFPQLAVYWRFLVLSKSVIPACFWRESRRNSDWTPDPFDVAQGRGEHNRTTIETSGVTTLRATIIKIYQYPAACCGV